MLPPGILSDSRERVTPFYTLLPAIGIVESLLPNFKNTVARIQAAPAIGANFVQMLLEMAPAAITERPLDADLEHFFYVLEGTVALEGEGITEKLSPGGFGYLPEGAPVSVSNPTEETSKVIWIKRRFERIDLPLPEPIFGNQAEIPLEPGDVQGSYGQLLLPFDDPAFDMGMSILHFEPGVYFDYVETHIMEHGLYMLTGQGIYYLGDDLMEVRATDFMYIAPYCPQFYFATGWENSSYLLYKDINRDIQLPRISP
jgi:(S)-ureidoglycine aminohydrolase